MATKTAAKTAAKTVAKSTAKAVKASASKPAKKAKAAPAPAPAPVVEVVETSRQQGFRIQEAMNSGLFTVPQIAAKTGLSENRVIEHVQYEISKNRSKLNTKLQVVVISQPRRRAEGK